MPTTPAAPARTTPSTPAADTATSTPTSRARGRQIWGVVTKDLRQWRRDRQAAAGPIFLPLVLMLLTTVLFGAGGDEWNIALITRGDGPQARQFAEAIEQSRGTLSPYFRIVTRDPDEARRLVEQGRLHMAVTIPDGFGEQTAVSEPPVVRTQVFNINTDMTKNVRLRLQHAIQRYDATHGDAPLVIEQVTIRDDDVWRRSFIAGGAVILAVLVGATLNTAITVAREWQRRTVKELHLAPEPVTAVAVGKLLAGLVAAAVNVAVALVVAVAVFGLRIPPDRWLPLLGFGGLAAVAAAGLGLAIGAAIRDYRAIQPLVLVTLAGSFFASGGYASVATLPPAVRAFNTVWPPAYVFEGMHALMHFATLPDLTALCTGLAVAALAGLAVGTITVRRVYRAGTV